MIEFEKQTWYNKNDTANAALRKPISASHLNRFEEAIDATVKYSNDMTNHWWRTSRVVGGDLEWGNYHASHLYFYIWDNTASATTIYYSNSTTIVLDEVTGESYVQLNDAKELVCSYSSLGSGYTYTLRSNYFIIGDSNTKSGATLYYAGNATQIVRCFDGNQQHSYGFYIYCSNSGSDYYVFEPTVHKSYGDIDYVSSSSKDAYINGWDDTNKIMYEYLGVPFENSRENCAIVTGWYLGNGEQNRLIRTPRKPRCIFLFNSSGLVSTTTETFSVNAGGYITLSNDGFLVSFSGYNGFNVNRTRYNYIVFY